MLAAAGSLTLELARALLPRGWQLKDATPGERAVPQCRARLRRPAVDRRARGRQLPLDRASPVRDDLPAAARRLGRVGAPDRLDAVESRGGTVARGARRRPRRAPLAEAAALAQRRPAGRARCAGGGIGCGAARNEDSQRREGALHPRALAPRARAAARAMRRESSRPAAPTGIVTRRRAGTTAVPISRPSVYSSRMQSPARGRGARSTSARTPASTARSPRARGTSSRSTSTSARSRRSGTARARAGCRSCRSSAISGARRQPSAGGTGSSSRC